MQPSIARELGLVNRAASLAKLIAAIRTDIADSPTPSPSVPEHSPFKRRSSFTDSHPKNVR
jgi:hypothetical protein